MSNREDHSDHLKQYMEYDADDPRFLCRILGMRVDALTKEKEDIEKELTDERSERKKLEDRVGKMEKSFQRGAGMLIILPVLGTIIGVLFAWGKVIFAPWLTK